MPKGPSRPYPAMPLDEVAKLAEGIRNASSVSNSMNRILLAEQLSRKPGSSDYRDMIASSAKFGFTKGNFNSEYIELTELGEQLTRPRNPSERLDALRKGMHNIPLFDKLLHHFNNGKLPTSDFLRNTLEREPFNVPAKWAEEAAETFITNGRIVGFIREVGGSQHIILDAGPPTLPTSELIPQYELGPTEISSPSKEKIPPLVDDITDELYPELPSQATQQSPSILQFFIAHGHDQEAVHQVQKILDELGIPYMVAAEEANVGRPISKKVKDLMDSCSAGIFIFSADEEFKDKHGTTLFRPRENVIYELGAASYVYDRRIVIFKEKSVTFPSDFSDLGYIEFDKGQLAGKTMELLRELIALKAVKLLPGA